MKLKHPESKRPIEVADGSAANYESQGWARVAEKPAKPIKDDE